MLRGFEWGLYILNGRLVRVKTSLSKRGAIVDICSMGKWSSMFLNLLLTDKLMREFIPIDFPEDLRLDGLITRRKYTNGKEEVELVETYTDAEVGGVYVDVLTGPKTKKVISLREFLDEYNIVEV